MSGCIGLKCSFCPKIDLEYSGLRQAYDSGAIPTQRPCHHYSCFTCHSEFYYDSSHSLIGWSFKVDYKGDRFYVLWLDDKTLLYKNGYVITEFTNRAHLTPSNLVQKLPTILTFL